MNRELAVKPPDAATEDLGAPLYVAWQLTNECNLSCLHCIEEAGPGKAFKDELSRDEASLVIDQLISSEVPYISFSGGEPMLRPDFFELAGRLTGAGAGLKIETNGHYLTPENCRALRGVKAVQVSLDGTTPASYRRLRPRGRFGSVIDGIKNLANAGIPLEINFVPSVFNIHEIGGAVDLAFRLGACGFYTGRMMRAGNAARSWNSIAPSEAGYAAFFDTLRAKAREYEGRMQVRFHEAGILEELRYRLVNPAAIFIILPDGKVKLINALPFICGDLKSQKLGEVWRNFRKGWKDPRVAEFVGKLERNPGTLSRLHQWVNL